MKFRRLLRNSVSHWFGSSAWYLRGFPKGPIELLQECEKHLTNQNIILLFIKNSADNSVE